MIRKFDTSPYIFSEMCSILKKFKIPPFQRSYDWRTKEINDLWESIISNDREYFIGNLVFLKPDENSDDRYIIIDGQQRLLTISLFLSAIKDEYGFIRCENKEDKERVEKSKNNIDNLLFYHEKRWPFEESLKILPGKENLKEIYGKLIKKEIDINNKEEIADLDDNQLKFAKNYRTIKRLVGKYANVKNTKFEKLDELQEKITLLLFISIICDSDVSAYKIFEGLNSTGIGLTVADLVKNAVLRVVRGKEARNKIEELWEEIERQFEQTKISLFPRFLRHQWIAHEGYITTNKLFPSIKEEKLKEANGKIKNENVISYVKELLEDTKTYVAFRFRERESHLLSKRKIKEKSLKIIRRFSCLNVEQVYEILLAFYNKFIKSPAYTDKQFINHLENLWIFCFRAKVISINPSEYERKFASHCVEIRNFKKEKFDRMSVKFFKELYKLVSNNEAFIENFSEELNYREGGDNFLVLYVLGEIMKNFDPKIKISEPTIEHIMPKDPHKWKLKKTDVKDYVNDIGNLTLLHDKDNKMLGNETMKVKVKKVFSKSAFKLNRKLTKREKGFTENPREAIKKRGRKLGEISNKIWQM